MLKTLAQKMVNMHVSPAKVLSQSSYLVTGQYHSLLPHVSPASTNQLTPPIQAN